MNDFLLQELKKNTEYCLCDECPFTVKDLIIYLTNTRDFLLNVASKTKIGGGFALSEIIQNIMKSTKGDVFSAYFVRLAGLVLDGADMNTIEDVGTFQYISLNSNGYNAISLIMALEAIRYIKEGTDIHIIETVLNSMIPTNNSFFNEIFEWNSELRNTFNDD